MQLLAIKYIIIIITTDFSSSATKLVLTATNCLLTATKLVSTATNCLQTAPQKHISAPHICVTKNLDFIG